MAPVHPRTRVSAGLQDLKMVTKTAVRLATSVPRAYYHTTGYRDLRRSNRHYCRPTRQ